MDRLNEVNGSVQDLPICLSDIVRCGNVMVTTSFKHAAWVAAWVAITFISLIAFYNTVQSY